MKIVAVSDMHGYLPGIPECDLFIIAGDICPTRNHTRPFQANWLKDIFNPWLKNVPAKNKVIIAGNHDWIFYDSKNMVLKLDCIYLENYSVEIEGIKLWGSPFSRFFCDWAFNAPENDELEVFLDNLYSSIPKDTDIIISHGPPNGYGDMTLEGIRTGSTKLVEHFLRTDAKLLFTGHIHEDRGIFKLSENKTIVNCSYLDRGYVPYENYAFKIIFEKNKGIVDISEIWKKCGKNKYN